MMTNQKTPTLRFSRLRLGNWKNFLEVDLPLAQRVFFVGPNASGKSNLLDVLRFLRDLVSEGGGLQAAINRRGGVKAIRCLAARRNSDVAISVAVAEAAESDSETFIWQYDLVFNQEGQHRAIIKQETVKRWNIETKRVETVLHRPTADDQKDPERLTQTYLEQVTMNQPFRGLAEFFASVRYLHIVPQLVREPERSVGRKNDPYGGDFLEQIARCSKKTQDAWLKRIEDALKVAVPRLTKIEMFRDHRGTPHLRAKYQHWRPQGAWQTEEQLSDGTLRLLGLLWAVLEGRGPLLLEEPELSLHPEVVRYIPQMLARVQRRTGRQVLVSTHSLELLRDEGLAPEEVVVLRPEKEATKVRRVADLADAKSPLESGLPAGEIAVSSTKPGKAKQLSLFGD